MASYPCVSAVGWARRRCTRTRRRNRQVSLTISSTRPDDRTGVRPGPYPPVQGPAGTLRWQAFPEALLRLVLLVVLAGCSRQLPDGAEAPRTGSLETKVVDLPETGLVSDWFTHWR